MNQVHRDDAFTIDLLPDLVKNYEGWEQRHFVPEVGLFWQIGHDDGMEFNINSRQTQGHPARRAELSPVVQRLHVGRRAGDRQHRRAGRGQGDIAERFETKADVAEGRRC